MLQSGCNRLVCIILFICCTRSCLVVYCYYSSKGEQASVSGRKTMYVENKIVSKAYRKAKTSWGIGCLLLIACLALLVVGIARFAEVRRNSRSLNEILESADSDKKNQMAYVDLIGMFVFAEQGDNREYYIGYDDNRYYIITMDSKGYDYCVKQYENASGRTFHITGYTDSIPIEARSLAVEGLNEESKKSVVTLASFNKVFGEVCLNVLEESKLYGAAGFLRSVKGEATGIFILLAIIGLTMFLIGRSHINTFTRALGPDNPHSDELIKEINGPDAEWIAEAKTYVTEHYMVSVTNEFSAARFEDIFWIYRTKHSTNGIHDYDYLNVITTDGRRQMIARGGAATKKRATNTEEIHERLLGLAAEKNPEAKIGFSSENQTAYNELRKTIKAKKAGI